MDQRASALSRHANCLLQALSQEDFDLLKPHLEPVMLEQDDVCIEVDAAIEYVHFLEGGLGSTVVPDEYHGTAEVGMQGREGLIGVSVLLDSDRSSHKVFMQTGGPSQRIRVGSPHRRHGTEPILAQIAAPLRSSFSDPDGPDRLR